jgi:mannose-6-phosphate isomerase-like protein (cupin superfamily)
MERVSLDDLERTAPEAHWGVASRMIEHADGRVSLQLCDMAVGGGAESHVHAAQDQMFVVLEGALEVQGESEETFVVRGGEALRIPAGAPHSTRNAAELPAKYLVLTYPAAQRA